MKMEQALKKGESPRHEPRGQTQMADTNMPGSSLRASHTIAVVGAGVSGLATVAAVVNKFSHDPISEKVKLTILWVDKKGTEDFGPGTVYQDHESGYDLNVPAKQMSIIEKDPDHFVKWLGYYNGGIYDKNDFVSRSVYAEYLRSCATRIINEAGLKNNLTIIKQGGDIEDVVRNGVYKVYTSPNAHLVADQVVLAVGHMPAEDPFDNELKGRDNYFQALDAKAHEKAINTLPSGKESQSKSIFIAGFGATAIDRIRLLDRVGYQGQITVVTRNSIRPWAYYPEHDDKEGYKIGFGISEVMKLAQGFVTNDNRARTKVINEFTELLMGEIKSSYAKNYGPQNFLYSRELDDLVKTPGISAQFAAEARKIVTLFKSNPTPPEDARLIEKYQSEGRLKIVIGEIIKPPAVEGDKISINYKPRSMNGIAETHQVTEKFDVVFNGAPFTRNYNTNSLLSRLSNKGMGRLGRETGIVERHENGQQLCPVGYFVVGPAASATWGVETFRKQADIVASSIIRNMRPNTTQTSSSSHNHSVPM